ncbi:hypothetical protein [Nocardioides sp. SYSU D00038]|uniref:hypothetical protein n=1 Tax=Nocardioides sp. SYSU D00038 TaxID=2812554 RepID=UPI00196730D4|nr:hypothetical protein [Nocardioides sp. SYSU D00038]
MDATTAARLDELRARDTTGIYAGDGPLTGTDPEGSLRVTLDPTHRLVSLEVLRIDRVRTPDGLDAALAGAWRDALVSRLGAQSAAGTGGARPVPTAEPVRRIGPSRELLERHRIRTEEHLSGRPRRRPGPVTGRSRNECVEVHLPPASSRGRVEALPAWLAHATATQVSAAVAEAFADAYSERDAR